VESYKRFFLGIFKNYLKHEMSHATRDRRTKSRQAGESKHGKGHVLKQEVDSAGMEVRSATDAVRAEQPGLATGDPLDISWWARQNFMLIIPARDRVVQDQFSKNSAF
jgi:hypothetical protein